MAKEIIQKLPETIVIHIEKLRKDYNDIRLNKIICRRSAVEYCRGLRDAGLITNTERQQLVMYILRNKY